MGDLTTP